ncbi:MAG TPA: zinc-dependent dehydrogenase [Beutenbergiaceae bacterium]|nr:zinc-dependent dehydrogenase [Beutenbergiaceae bacterium]
MKAVVFDGPGQVELREVPDPAPGPGEVVLAVGANTICGTDVRIIRGEKTTGIDPGVVLGHEVAGHISAVGVGVEDFAVGDLVGLTPILSCGNCFYCNRDTEQLCPDVQIVGNAVDGGLADFMKVPARAVARGNLVRTEADLDPAHLALAEPISCCLSGLRNYGVAPGETVVILGAGPIGLIHTQLARLRGAGQVIVSDPNPDRRRVATDLGADLVFDGGANLAEQVADLTGGRGADAAIVCIGRPELFGQALSLTRKAGRVNLFAGFPKGGSATVDPNLVHYGEITVTGASNARRSDYADAVALIASGRIDTGALVTHRFDLSDAMTAIETVASGSGIKVAVQPGQR